jgi:hypothetical protein
LVRSLPTEGLSWPDQDQIRRPRKHWAFIGQLRQKDFSKVNFMALLTTFFAVIRFFWVITCCKVFGDFSVAFWLVTLPFG